MLFVEKFYTPNPKYHIRQVYKLRWNRSSIFVFATSRRCMVASFGVWSSLWKRVGLYIYTVVHVGAKLVCYSAVAVRGNFQIEIFKFKAIFTVCYNSSDYNDKLDTCVEVSYWNLYHFVHVRVVFASIGRFLAYHFNVSSSRGCWPRLRGVYCVAEQCFPCPRHSSYSIAVV